MPYRHAQLAARRVGEWHERCASMGPMVAGGDRHFRVLPCFALVLASISATLSCALLRQDRIAGLHAIQRIHLGPGLGGYESMRTELVKAGFTVVDTPDTADAILTGSKSETLVVDAPPPDPPEIHFTYELARGPSVIWTTTFTVRSRSSETALNAEAARRCAERLLKAWRNSAKK